jgi:histidinol phosphatase-like enzyme (inositol monophosphatase family)
MTDLADALAFAETLADAARAAILPHFRGGGRAENKAAEGYDPVTEADRASEAAMRALIRARFPHHAIEGEEFADHEAEGDWRWILDPIDGTRAFIAGLPTWGVLIALAHKGRPVLGVLDQPFTGERWRGFPGGADHESPHSPRRPIATRRAARLDEALLMTTDRYLFAGDELSAFERLRAACRLTRYGMDCYAYGALALGGVDLVFESGLKPVDIAALIPIVEGAGGVVLDWTGAPASSARPLGGRVLAASSSSLAEAALALSPPSVGFAATPP